MLADEVVGATQSPIEAMMARALLDLGLRVTPQRFVLNGDSHLLVDLAVTIGRRRIAIECDGYEYHHTRDQIARDRKRERILQAKGWTVIRFSGSEIHRDPRACAREVLSIARAHGGTP